ncbi:MAG: HU family DNA-binding protein [Muribaculaceae bacterium]|nr:HU family DNA-binding protein [Muribaculaceae bacterium]
MNAKVTMPDLVAQVAESTRTTKRMSELFLRELFATITQSLLDGESVSVDGLGTFKADAATGVTFTPAAALARVLNQPFEAFEPVELSDDLTNDMLAELLSPAPAKPSAEPAEPVEAAEPEETQPAPMPAPATEPQPEPEEPTMAAEPQPAGESPLATQATQATVNELQQKLSEAGRDIEDLKNSLVNMRRAFRQGLLMGAAMVLITALLALGAWALYNRFSGNGGSQAPATAQTAPEATSTDTVATPAPATPATPPVTETVSETNYLSLIAQRHYGLPEYWVYIYEENIDKIDNPNRVKNGTVIVVPPPEKYGINAADPASVAKAKIKSTELYNLFKNKK